MVISKKEAIEQGLGYYNTGKPCKYGHFSDRYLGGACVECRREKNNSDEHKAYDRSSKRRDDKREYKKTEKYKKQQRKYNEDNREVFREYYREYQKSDQYKKNRSIRNKVRYKEDISYKTQVQCRNLLFRVLSLTKNEKDGSTFDILGYSSEDFVESLQSKFIDGMSWENHGDVWEVDHLIPVSRYLKDGVDDPKVINSLDNLIPMFKQHNRDKSDMVLSEYLEVNPETQVFYKRFLDE